jgi:hypothetical protein
MTSFSYASSLEMISCRDVTAMIFEKVIFKCSFMVSRDS